MTYLVNLVPRVSPLPDLLEEERLWEGGCHLASPHNR